MNKLKTITVIGANGTMGCNVSGIFASFGDAKVYMVCRSIEAAKKAQAKASLSVKAETIGMNLIPRTYDDLEECISCSDVVFESVAEDFNIKRDVYSKIVKFLKPQSIVGTGTSGLSIKRLSECFPESIRRNFLGLHFYNPPYNMILCEVIPSDYTDVHLLDELKQYLNSVLYRKVVEVKDSPAFMGNRIGFQFINEAMQYAERYKDKGGIDYIDSILGPYSGRSMAPLVTSDFVGLDIHQAIVDNVYSNAKDYAHDTFILPDFVLGLISENKLGRKTGCGLYQTILNSDGSKEINVYDIASKKYRPRKKYSFSFAKRMIEELKISKYSSAFKLLATDDSLESNICMQFLIKYVIYGITTAREIGKNIHSADDVMASGFNWAPPLAIIDAFGGIDSFLRIIHSKVSNEFHLQVNVNEIFQNIPESHYDYRPFFKAK